MASTPDHWEDIESHLQELEALQSQRHPHPHILFPAFLKTAQIQVRLARINDISTRRVVHLTWALVALTFALLLLTALLYNDTHQMVNRDEPAEHGAAPQPAPDAIQAQQDGGAERATRHASESE